MKILVTGGAGFIGSNFIRHVLASGSKHSVVNYDKLTYAGNLANLDSVATHPDYSLFVATSVMRQHWKLPCAAVMPSFILLPSRMSIAAFTSRLP